MIEAVGLQDRYEDWELGTRPAGASTVRPIRHDDTRRGSRRCWGELGVVLSGPVSQPMTGCSGPGAQTSCDGSCHREREHPGGDDRPGHAPADCRESLGGTDAHHR